MSWMDLHPFIREAGNTTLAVGLLCLLVLLIRRPFAERYGAKAAYMLWLVPLARFVMPPLPQSWSLSGWLGLGQSAPTVNATNAVSTTSTTVVASGASQPAPGAVPELGVLPEAVVTPGIVGAPVETAIVSAQPVTETAWWMTALQASGDFLAANWLGLAVLVWGLGALVWLARGLRRQDVFMRLVREDSEPAPQDIVAKTAHLAREIGLKRVPEVRMSLLCSGPLVTGLKNPVVLLPLWFEEDYTESERRDALIHELMHLKRKDLWAFQMARIVVATQWFNPLAHIALMAFRTDQEAACDADVLKQKSVSKVDYGRTLIKAARLARPSDRRFATASLTLAHPIKERIKLMTKPTPSLRSRLTGTAIAGAIGAGALFVTASSISTAQELKGGEAEVEKTFIDNKNTITMTLDGETYSLTLDQLPPMPPMPALPEMPGLDLSSSEPGNFSLHIDTDEMLANGNMEAFEAAMEEWAGEIEAWAESIEGNSEVMEVAMEAWGEEMEVWGEQFEARMEAWAEKAEPQIEAWAEQIAEKHEHSARYDREEYVERDPETRDIEIGNFDAIEVSGGMIVSYSQEATPTAKAVLTRGDWDEVEIKVKDRTLYVGRNKDSRRWNGRGPQVKVYATSKKLKRVETSSGAIFEGDVVADAFKADASSGSVITLSGACKSTVVDASSGAVIESAAMQCDRANIDASSGAVIKVYASKVAKADASSGANVTISGSPTDVSSDKSSGAVIRIQK
jgi:beta-lactamase regulating signal transducer with metallopeptidase domain